MTKMKQVTYASLPYMSKLAACMYPDLVPKDIQYQMKVGAMSQGKKSPMEGKIERDHAYLDQARGKQTQHRR